MSTRKYSFADLHNSEQLNGLHLTLEGWPKANTQLHELVRLVYTLPTSCMSCSCLSWDSVWCRRDSCRGVSPSLSVMSNLAFSRTKSYQEEKSNNRHIKAFHVQCYHYVGYRTWLSRMHLRLGRRLCGETAQGYLSFGQTHLWVTSSVFIDSSIVQAWCSCQIRDWRRFSQL